MKSFTVKFIFLLSVLQLIGCQKKSARQSTQETAVVNEIQYAKGLEIYHYRGYSVVKVTQPWPGTTKPFTYILQEKNGVVPDSLRQYTVISVPIQSIVVTSTTHIPALEMLGVENSLIGFPNTDFVSSPKTRKRIDSGQVQDVGSNETLNTEILIDKAPDVLVSFGLNNSNPTLDNLQKSGLKVLLNGDWNEQSPLGKAEWIKFFGALYQLDTKAKTIFATIEKEYQATLALAQKAKKRPTVLCGAMYQDQWFVPQGESWMALFLKEAKSNYLWAKTKGSGGLQLPFETILVTAQKAEFWIAPGNFTSLQEMNNSNPHYEKFQAFKNKEVYSYALHKGAKGGILFFEWSSTRPDWVLNDLISIFHPELLPNYQPHFFEKLN